MLLVRIVFFIKAARVGHKVMSAFGNQPNRRTEQQQHHQQLEDVLASTSKREDEESRAPRLGHTTFDPVLRGLLLDRYLAQSKPRQEPGSLASEVEEELERWGQRVISEVHPLGRQAGLPESEPKLVSAGKSAINEGRDWDWAWRKREDSGATATELQTSESWKKLHEIAAEEGLVACAYDGRERFGRVARVYQFAKLYMFNASSGMYSCPLAMTDGAARVCERIFGRDHVVYRRAFKHLVTRDPKEFWTSGQWMTEIDGGSDVGDGITTFAEPLESQGWADASLHGYKWFTSATDARMAFTLARERSQKTGELIPGSKGLSLFYIEVEEASKSNRIRIARLKGKLGTRQMPTAELSLDGVPCKRVSASGKGVSAIAEMMNCTRLHNAVTAAAYMRRVATISLDYATRRKVFGRLLLQHSLAIHVLAHFEVHAHASLMFTLEAACLLGKQEVGEASKSDLMLLRVVTPLVKLFTAKQVVLVVSEGLEFFGGQGYIEGTGIPELLRDAQVLPIWEGTTNVLCLDMLRAIRKDQGAGVAVLLDLTLERVKAVDHSTISSSLHRSLLDVVEKVRECRMQVRKLLGHSQSSEREQQIGDLRNLAFMLSKLFICGLLVEKCRFISNENHIDTAVASAWMQSIRTTTTCTVDLGSFEYNTSKTIVSGSQRNLRSSHDGHQLRALF